MPTLYVCASGHQWRSDDGPLICPACGQPALPAPDFDGGTPAGPSMAVPVGRTFLDAMATVAHPAPRADEPPPVEPPPGYQILREEARGGMGVVYRALQLNLNRLVALKMIRRADIEQHDLARFRVEAEAVAQLDHPHIVRIYDFGEHQGRPYLCMEFVGGGSLARRLEAGSLVYGEAAHLVEMLALAMHHAHSHGIIHRDLKPSNVLMQIADLRLQNDNQPRDSSSNSASCNPQSAIPKIADFGLAKRLDADLELTPTRVVIGTASYMAPEQARGHHQVIGPATDLYALGTILYECLTGRPPFAADTWEMTLLQLLNDEPLRPTLLRPGVPVDLEQICLKCLEKEPSQRYPSALALADDLRRFQAGEPLSIRPVDEWERLGRWARKAGYQLLDIAGCTVLGMVYKAMQVSLNRTVLLKTISSRAQSDPQQMQRFRHEAEVVAHIHHPNIVQIYDFGECQGQPYLSLEFVDGGTLADRCPDWPLPPGQAAQLVRTLAKATHAAHQRGIVHADLRPFNVLLTVAGHPKITGFGLAWLLQKEEQSPESQNQRVLSNYMAPEQAGRQSTPLTPATDVHALGAMLYEMLTGQPPFLAETVRGTLDQVLTRQPQPPSQLVPGLPAPLESICLRCLRKDPAERFHSAENLAEELRRFLASEHPSTGEFELIPGYELLEEVGRGGTGVVYKARQLSLDRLVAVKVFREHAGRVLTANQAVARLSHPNLLPVHDCGERDGLWYVVEDLMEGQTLEQWIAGKPRPPREVAGIGRVLAETMHQVHQHGIIHRNLKPSVVFLTRQGVPRIGSFDLAFLRDRELDSADREGRLVGTPRYMAPEQANGETQLLGPATDVYALGGILYEMLTGRPAFVHGSLIDEIALVRSRPPLPPRFFQPEVPPELEMITLKCLEKEPGRRFTSAQALAEALARLASGP